MSRAVPEVLGLKRNMILKKLDLQVLVFYCDKYEPWRKGENLQAVGGITWIWGLVSGSPNVMIAKQLWLPHFLNNTKVKYFLWPSSSNTYALKSGRLLMYIWFWEMTSHQQVLKKGCQRDKNEKPLSNEAFCVMPLQHFTQILLCQCKAL